MTGAWTLMHSTRDAPAMPSVKSRDVVYDVVV
ncbi:Uncharacterised protein [Mycobacteroides abscessus subsp. abscessus]|nr:Uncharacterised protein [Mycobacteroides abscessus subsp. abscessus]